MHRRRIGELPLGAAAKPGADHPAKARPACADRFRSTETIGTTPDGTCVRDYIHVLDLAAAHVRSPWNGWMRRPRTSLIDVFNVGHGARAHRSVQEALDAFERSDGATKSSVKSPRAATAMSSRSSRTATKVERDALGWKTTRSIADAMRDAWRLAEAPHGLIRRRRAGFGAGAGRGVRRKAPGR